MEIAEVTLSQIRDKYSVPRLENDDSASFTTGISELLREIRNESRSSGMIPLLETMENRIQSMLKEKTQALLNQRLHIEELQSLVRSTTAQMRQFKTELLVEKSKASTLEKQLARETSTLRSLQKSLDVTSVDLELNSSRAQAKITEMQRQLEEATSISEECNRARHAAEEKVSYLEKKHKDLNAELSKLEFEKGLAERKLKESEQKREILAKEMEAACLDSNIMLSDMKSVAENELLLQNKIRVLERDLEGALGGTDSQVQALRTEAAYLRRTLDSLREERRQARETVTKQHAELQNLRAAQVRATMEAPPQPDVSSQRLLKIQNQLRTREAELDAMNRELDEKSKKLIEIQLASGLRQPDAGSEPRVLPPFHLFNLGTADLPATFGMAASCVIARILIINAPLGDDARRVADNITSMVLLLFLALFSFKMFLRLREWLAAPHDDEQSPLLSTADHVTTNGDEPNKHYQNVGYLDEPSRQSNQLPASNTDGLASHMEQPGPAPAALTKERTSLTPGTGSILRSSQLKGGAVCDNPNQEVRPPSDERLKSLKDTLGPRVAFNSKEAVSSQVGQRLQSLRNSAHCGQVTNV